MTVNKLFLEGFRNYIYNAVDFCDGINVITGRNAQGKTNLIEAIYYLAAGKTFRTASDSELISFEKETACVRAEVTSCQREQTLEIKIYKKRRREMHANGVKLKNAGELAGRLTAVLFCPDDLSLIREGASVRRRLMDNALSQLRPGYIAALSEFNRLYGHKTRILRDHFEKPSLLELLDDFSRQLAVQSAKLIYYRAAYARMLEEHTTQIHKEFSGSKENLSIRYKTAGEIDPQGKKPEQLFPELMEHQQRHREAELRSGLCLSGAHKDDLEVEINGKPARKYASQGQARTASVSIKLAERDIISRQKGESPVLLLDDVLSELDAGRQEFILGKIGHGQVFITCCDDAAVKKNFCTPALRDFGKLLVIESGNIKETA